MTSTSSRGEPFTDAERAHLILRLTLGLNILARCTVDALLLREPRLARAR